MTATDVQKILNLKRAWEFILDRDVVASRSDYYMLSHIARLVNEGFFAEGGRIRGVPVTIGGSSYVPPLPNELDVKDHIREIAEESGEAIDIAIKLCLYGMKTQIFLDGNKRVSVIFANHYLISHGGGFLVIPEKEVPEFKRLLVKYYEGEDISIIGDFMNAAMLEDLCRDLKAVTIYAFERVEKSALFFFQKGESLEKRKSF